MRAETAPAVGVEVRADRARDRERIRRGVVYCLGVFAAVRVALTLVAALGTALLPHLDPVGVPGWPAPEPTAGVHNFVTAWERFDALWFLRIADGGYVDGDGSAAFFPLYPLLIRGLSPVLGGHPLAAALLISNAAFLGALITLYLLTAPEWGERVARRSVLYLAVFPTALFFLAPYSESPFLFLALLSFWAARRGRWEVAGVAGALAAATRSIGIVLAAALLVEGIHQWREGRPGSPARPAVWALMVGSGTGLYLAYWGVVSGDWLAPFHQQAGWQREFELPWATLWAGTREAFRWIGQYPGGYHLLDWLLVIPALVAAGWVALRARPGYTVYTWGALLVPLSYVFADRPFMSLPRFLLVAFPLVWAAAVWAERRRGVHEALLGLSAMGLGVMLVLFANWYFVF